MPNVLIGRVKGGTTKADRHAIARKLFERRGLSWPPGEPSHHELDALCQIAAWLAEEGLL